MLDDGDREMFVATLAEACKRTGWRVLAWVLMDNHYHWLVRTPEQLRRLKRGKVKMGREAKTWVVRTVWWEMRPNDDLGKTIFCQDLSPDPFLLSSTFDGKCSPTMTLEKPYFVKICLLTLSC